MMTIHQLPARTDWRWAMLPTVGRWLLVTLMLVCMAGCEQRDEILQGKKAEKALTDVLVRRCHTRVQVLEIVHAVYRRERDPTEWYMFRISPEQCASFQRALQDNANPHELRSSTRIPDRLELAAGSMDPPSWWRPFDYPDLEVLCLGGRSIKPICFNFAFSPKEGVVFLVVL
jgi:hypothetical protein